MSETKHEKFKRLAVTRGERVLRELRLLGNLSNVGNYEYTEDDVKILFSVIESELKACKAQFHRRERRRRIEL